jgi:outer membrane protein
VIDLITELPVTAGSKAIHIAVFTDMFTKWPEATPLTSKSAQDVADTFFRLIICRHGWVNLAEKQNYTVLAQEAALEIARLETKRNAAGHQPTLDLVASHNYTSQSGSQFSGIGSSLTNDSVSLQFALPLYQGGGVSSREREAAYNQERTHQELENARRTATLITQQAYLLVINGIAQVGALEQALVSSQSALQSNRLGYEVGVRINIDVLNAQQQVFSTRRDLALARYNTITSQLRLKAAAGALREEDLEVVNRALLPPL